MSDKKSISVGCNCVGCLWFTVLLLFGWALLFGLPVPGDKKINIDIFPPRIWDMNEGGK